MLFCTQFKTFYTILINDSGEKFTSSLAAKTQAELVKLVEKKQVSEWTLLMLVMLIINNLPFTQRQFSATVLNETWGKYFFIALFKKKGKKGEARKNSTDQDLNRTKFISLCLSNEYHKHIIITTAHPECLRRCEDEESSSEDKTRPVSNMGQFWTGATRLVFLVENLSQKYLYIF